MPREWHVRGMHEACFGWGGDAQSFLVVFGDSFPPCSGPRTFLYRIKLGSNIPTVADWRMENRIMRALQKGRDMFSASTEEWAPQTLQQLVRVQASTKVSRQLPSTARKNSYVMAWRDFHFWVKWFLRWLLSITECLHKCLVEHDRTFVLSLFSIISARSQSTVSGS